MQSAIPASMLQIPIPSESTLSKKRGSFDSGYSSPKKKDNIKEVAPNSKNIDDQGILFHYLYDGLLQL